MIFEPKISEIARCWAFQQRPFQKSKIHAKLSRLKYHVIKKMHLKIPAIILFTKNPHALENVKCIHKITQILNHNLWSIRGSVLVQFGNLTRWSREDAVIKVLLWTQKMAFEKPLIVIRVGWIPSDFLNSRMNVLD